MDQSLKIGGIINPPIIADETGEFLISIGIYDLCVSSDKEFIVYKSSSKNQMDIIKIFLTDYFTNYIIDKYEEGIIKKILDNEYYYLSAKERDSIKEITKEKIESGLCAEFKTNMFRLKTKNIISRKLIEYLKDFDEIFIEGFKNFRLKEYNLEIEGVVLNAADDFFLQREYDEFITMLKFFVNSQTSKAQLIHIFVSDGGNYEIKDKSGFLIKNEHISNYEVEEMCGEITSDDVLISSIISLAPEKIMFHNKKYVKNTDLLNTIERVFGKKLIYCDNEESVKHNNV